MIRNGTTPTMVTKPTPAKEHRPIDDVIAMPAARIPANPSQILCPT
jgi:hypothetical protein